eukprot:5945746-Prorocentrum_lima.AAC.1
MCIRDRLSSHTEGQPPRTSARKKDGRGTGRADSADHPSCSSLGWSCHAMDVSVAVQFLEDAACLPQRHGH